MTNIRVTQVTRVCTDERGTEFEIRKSVLCAVEECPHTIHDDGPLNGPIDPDDESDGQ